MSLAAALIAFGSATGALSADKLSVNLTTHQVAITSGFNGAEITLFGAVQRGPAEGPRGIVTSGRDDVIVVIRGPALTETVRRKERTAGIWINRAAVRFEDVPGFYFVASTRPLGDLLPESWRERDEIGVEHISLDEATALTASLTDEEIEEFRQAIVRQKTNANLYGQSEKGVTLQDNTLFSMRVDIPANVPVGTYVAQVLLVRDGAVIASQSLRPRVGKTGIERRIFRFAHGYPLFYGIAAVLIAVFAGWSASIIFRRS